MSTQLKDEMLNNFQFNFNRPIAIDIKTIAVDVNGVKRREIIEICVCVLNYKLELARSIIPFSCLIKPPLSPYYIKDKSLYPSIGVTSKYYLHAFNQGLDKRDAFDIFEKWVSRKIKLLEGRKLMVVTYDWASKKPFLIDWMGELNFEHWFHFHVRDILPLALFANDFAIKNLERPPYPKVDFHYLCGQSRVDHGSDTILNCMAIAKIYQLMLHSWYGHVPTGT